MPELDASKAADAAAGPATEAAAGRAALRRAAVAAVRAPSVHNTQPWRMVLDGDVLELRADGRRRLTVLDPDGRQMMMSLGCALLNARVALAAEGAGAQVDRMPDAADPELVARITVSDAPVDATLGALAAVIEERRANRRRFEDDAVPEEVIGQLESAASAEGVQVLVLRSEEDRTAAAVLSQRADAMQTSDPAYQEELRAWISTDAQRADGVPVTAAPHAGEAHDDIPIRVFDTEGQGGLPTETHSSIRQCLFVLAGRGDAPGDWLRGGEALERLWLEAAALGYAASPLTQSVEVRQTRLQMRSALRTEGWPLVMVRVGKAPATPATPRRPLEDLLEERTADGEQQ
jgi:nitroreductase